MKEKGSVSYKIHNKDEKINVFFSPCVNYGISFHLDGFWNGFCHTFLMQPRATT